MKIESRLAVDGERLGVDEEADCLPDGIEVVDFGDEPIFCFCLPPGDYVLTLEGSVNRFRPNGTYLVQSSNGSGFIKRIS